jgi:Cytochrome c3
MTASFYGTSICAIDWQVSKHEPRQAQEHGHRLLRLSQRKPAEAKCSDGGLSGLPWDYKRLAAKTERLNSNPHDSHLGEIDCEKCHHSHKPQRVPASLVIKWI